MIARPIGFSNLGVELIFLALLRDQMHSLHETVVNAEADASMSSEQRKCDGAPATRNCCASGRCAVLNCAGCAVCRCNHEKRNHYCKVPIVTHQTPYCNVQSHLEWLSLVSIGLKGIGFRKDTYVRNTTQHLLGRGI